MTQVHPFRDLDGKRAKRPPRVAVLNDYDFSLTDLATKSAQIHSISEHKDIELKAQVSTQ
jgi:hypothetical protein